MKVVCFHYHSKVFEHGMFSLSTAMTPKSVYSMFMGSLQKGLSQSTAGLAAIPYCFACKQNHMTLIREWFSTFYDVFDINRPRSEQFCDFISVQVLESKRPCKNLEIG